MGSGYSTVDARLPGFTLAAPILNIRPEPDPADPPGSVAAAFDDVEREARAELAQLQRDYGESLRAFLAGGHEHSRWLRFIARDGDCPDGALALGLGDLGVHFDGHTPAVVRAVLAVQVAAYLALRTKSQVSAWRDDLIRQLQQTLQSWPGTSIDELALAARTPARLEALAVEPLRSQPGDAAWSPAVTADLARIKARILMAHVHHRPMPADALRGVPGLKYEDRERLFVLAAALASDSEWKTLRPKMQAAVQPHLKRYSPATGLHDLLLLLTR